MSNYTKTVDFAAKDALATGNAAKIVKGTEIDTEYNNIATSSATKLDITSSVASTATSYTVTGSGLPVNGMYLPAANTVGLASNSVLRGSVNSTGNWTIVGASAGTSLLLSGIVAGTYALGVIAVAGADASFGIVANNGTLGTADLLLRQSSSGQCTLVNRANAALTIGTNGTTYFQMSSAGVVSQWEGTVNIGTAGLMAGGTYESGSFTATLTGCTTSPTATVNWTRSGSVVSLQLPTLTATSNTTACTLTGMPAALEPARFQRGWAVLADNTVTTAGSVSVTNGSTVITLYAGSMSASGFTNSGTKGSNLCTFTYSLV